jgi:hypothetical protein
MNKNDNLSATPKQAQKQARKNNNTPTLVGDAETKCMKELWLAISVDLVFHPKLICAAMDLDVDEAHMLGILTRMWLMAFKYAKDGELWRGDDEATYRFVCVITGYKGDAKRLVEVLRRNRWLDGWLIHDWLDYVGAFLIRSFKTSRRSWLVATWMKHGMTYGAGQAQEGGGDGNHTPDGEPPDDGGRETEPGGNDSGSNQEVAGNQRGSKKALQPKPSPNPTPTQPINREIEPKTLSPPALKNMQRKTLNGGLGETAVIGDALDGMEITQEPARDRGFLNFVKEGGQAEGLNTPDFPLSLVTVEDVYTVYQNTLRFHGVITTRLLQEKTTYCRTTPAAWTVMLQDKIHAAYRDREGGPLIDTSGTDPVAMTIAALRPQNGDKRHMGTEASTNFFTEVMIDFAQMCLGRKSAWQNRLSAAAIAFELERRKGKRGRRRSA